MSSEVLLSYGYKAQSYCSNLLKYLPIRFFKVLFKQPYHRADSLSRQITDAFILYHNENCLGIFINYIQKSSDKTMSLEHVNPQQILSLIKFHDLTPPLEF